MLVSRIKYFATVFLISIISPFSYGQALVSFSDPFQMDTHVGATSAKPLDGDLWDRDSHDTVGVIFTFTSLPGFRASDGDKWVFDLISDASGSRLARSELVYNESADCVFLSGAQLFCGTKDVEASWSVRLFYRGMQCLSTNNYRYVITEQLQGGAATEVSASPILFHPTRFKPKVIADSISRPSNLKPKAYASSRHVGEVGTIFTRVIDNLSCAQPIEGAEIEFITRVVPGTMNRPGFRGGSNL